MRQIQAANLDALLGSSIMPRDFIEIVVKDRITGAPVAERLWSDRWDVTAPVIDLATGASVPLVFQGAAGLVAADDLAMGSNLEVQEISIRFAAFGVDVDRIFRLYDPTHAKVTIWRGFLNVDTRRLVADAEPVFFGFVDDIALPSGPVGEEEFATVTCVSQSQELTRYNPETRSDASQRLRSATDEFFKGSNELKSRVFFWGRYKQPATPPVATPRPSRPPKPFGWR